MAGDDERRAPVLILGKANGQLGNRLLAHAHGYALAREYGLRFVDPWLAPYDRYFVGTQRRGAITASTRELAAAAGYRLGRVLARVPGSPLIARNVRRREQRHDLAAVWAELAARRPPPRVVALHAFYSRCDELCQRHGPAIRRRFTPLPVLRRRADRLLADLRASHDHVLGVHIRQGDFAHHAGGRWFYSSEAYAAWMRAYRAQCPGQRVAFVVCSDRRQEPAAFAGLTVAFGPGQADTSRGGNRPRAAVRASIIEDNYALAGCDAIVGPPSTFSAWAAYWGDVPLLHLADREQRIERGDFQRLAAPR